MVVWFLDYRLCQTIAIAYFYPYWDYACAMMSFNWFLSFLDVITSRTELKRYVLCLQYIKVLINTYMNLLFMVIKRYSIGVT